MELHQLDADDRREVHSVRRDGGDTVVADFGPDASDASVDVVEDTAIVITDGEQFDIELPESTERALMRNGVLTIELEAEE